MRLPPYSAYKPSGVEWLGDVPQHWTLKRLKDGGHLIAGSAFPEDYQGIEDEELPFYKVADLAATIDGRTLLSASNTISDETANRLRAPIVPAGATVYAKIGAALLLNRRRLTSMPCCIDNNMSAYVPYPTVLSSEWAYYWTCILDFRELANPGAIPSLSEGYQRTLPLLTPPLSEQRAIADFLDARTARIDALVTKKRELVEKLKEKRAALISRTVTRGLPPEAARAAGLDPRPRLKPSGVEWLGDVPEHWPVKAFKRICTRVDVGIAEATTHAYSDDGVPIIRSTNVHAGFVDTSELLRISKPFAEKNRSKTLHTGDLVTVRTGHPGTTAEIPTELDGCQCFTLVMSTLKASESPRYYCYFFNSNAGFNHFQVEGWGTAQTNISVPIVQEMSVLEPPLIEQEAIADYLNYTASKIGQLSAHVDAAIDRLQEYRTALITAAVTGKIDVRGIAVSGALAVPQAAA